MLHFIYHMKLKFLLISDLDMNMSRFAISNVTVMGSIT